jgi:transketolase
MRGGAELIEFLKQKAKTIRRDSIEMIRAGGMGWLGGSFSQADIVAALVFHHMRHDPKNPEWPQRDRLIVSKAHCCETIYAALAESGYFSKKEYESYGKLGALLQAHTDRRVPGIEYSGGSLGQGLSFALGQALTARMEAPRDSSNLRATGFRVFCIVGDGESNEGQVWEAAMAAAHYRVDNLVVLVDHNKFQSSGSVEERMNYTPLREKWRSFGWDTIEIDGHSFDEILKALERADGVRDAPHAIIAHTVKGKGVPEFENRNLHFCPISDEMYARALEALR